MAAELYTPLQLPCTSCKLTFNTIWSYHRHIYGGYYSSRTDTRCNCKYDHLEELKDLEELAISRIDKKYPYDTFIDLELLCTFGTNHIYNMPVIIDENDTSLTGTVMLYNDDLKHYPIISIKPNDLTLSTYIFEQLSQRQNDIYYICKNTDTVDLSRVKKMQIPIIPIEQQQEYVNSCGKLHAAFNLIIHGDM